MELRVSEVAEFGEHLSGGLWPELDRAAGARPDDGGEIRGRFTSQSSRIAGTEGAESTGGAGGFHSRTT
jgi:hypothetical protein